MKLPANDASRILRLLTSLDEYGANQLELEVLRNGSDLDHSSRYELRNELRKHPKVLERYLKGNPDRLDPHLDAVRSLLKATEKLRGGDDSALHSTALGLLRWSTRLAATCLEGEPDQTAIRKQMGQIRKCYNRIDNILD